MHPFISYFFFCGILLTSAFGCEPKGGRLHPARVTVTLDGELLPEGTIYFHSLNGGAPAGGNLKDGKSDLSVLAGWHRVEIRADGDPLPPPPEWKGREALWRQRNLREQIIPKIYNTKSTLTAEVTPDGPNEFSFDLKSN